MEGKTSNMTTANIVCYAPHMILTGGIWKHENPFNYSFPLFVLQLFVVISTSRFLHLILKPFRQPRVISEILGGLILGPSVLGQSEKFGNTLFPLRSTIMYETMANLGLVYFLFLVGLEMEPALFRQTGKKVLVIALAGMLLPLVISFSSTFLFQNKLPTIDQGSYILFFGLALSVTAFPLLARILGELKLLNMEIGRIALSSALVNDMCAWFLLTMAIALAENKAINIATFWMLLSSAAFVLLCFYVVRPMIVRVVEQTPDGETFNDTIICLILAGVMISGFITDAIGIHAVFGAFIFGLVIPNGSLAFTLIEKLEDSVSAILLPLFFSIPGLKMNISEFRGSYNWVVIVIIALFAYIGKIVGTLFAALFYKMPFHEAVALGFLMNAKGVIEMIILNLAKKHNVLDEKSFAIMVLMTILMTGLISPVVTTMYRPAKRIGTNKWRVLGKRKDMEDLRILVCIHTPRNVATIINLLEASNPSNKSSICIFVLHLIELTGRPSSLLIVSRFQDSNRPGASQSQSDSDQITKAFKNLEVDNGSIMVNYFTVNSPYSTMHEDVCNFAEQKCTSFIILPFHKQQTVDGGMGPINSSIRTLNRNVLANAPCSIGILIDRGFSGWSSSQLSQRITMLFFGGADDREALAYAVRMAEGSRNILTIIRFLPSEDTGSQVMAKHDKHVTTIGRTEERRHKTLDDDYIEEIRMEMGYEDTFFYREIEVNNGEETMGAIRSLDDNHDLFIVGRGEGRDVLPLMQGLTDWSECRELGVIGDLLASADFPVRVSVLIVQQYVGVGLVEEEFKTA